MSVQILHGDCRDVLKTLPDESVHCVVTSPPYWGLRDYGVDGQLGMEKTYQEHITTIVAVFDEVRRVLRKDGSLWLNYGDSYATAPNGKSAADYKSEGKDDRTFRDKPFSTVQGILKSKDLCGIPWRVAFALQDRGWYLRQDIIWAKPNPMPESIKDRCTKSHDYIFMLTKSPRYYYDADAIAEDAVYAGLTGQDESGYKDAKKYEGKHSDKQRGHGRRHAGFNDRWDAMTRKEQCSGKRNKRSVWTVATKPFSQAHFATFPPDLIEPCILAGCPEQCCAKCGAPHVRMTSKTLVPGPKAAKTFIIDKRDHGADKKDQGSNRQKDGHRPGWRNEVKTLGWKPTCACDAGAIPGTVLDPFGGAGTAGLVADRNGRNAILIELNPAYATMAIERINGDAPLFGEVAA